MEEFVSNGWFALDLGTFLLRSKRILLSYITLRISNNTTQGNICLPLFFQFKGNFGRYYRSQLIVFIC